MITINGVYEASQRLRGVARITELLEFNGDCNCNLYFKAENLQKTGSFKIRGAYNKAYQLKETKNAEGVWVHGTGNHSDAVKYAAKILNLKIGEEYQLVHECNDDAVIMGQATVGLEILAQLPLVDIIILPIGGGGLASGVGFIAKALKPHVQVIGVKSQNKSSFASYISNKKMSRLTTEYCQKYIDDIIEVSDAEIAESMLQITENQKLIVEGSAAATLAAAIKIMPKLSGKNVVCVLSGANVKFENLIMAVQYGAEK